MTRDGELLLSYAETQSDESFAALVERYLGLVYSAALRQVNGDAALAQDVAQTVFADLARKAGSLSVRESLAGWLYTSTHFAAAKAVRSEQRRQAREREAHTMHELLQNPEADADWSRLEPVLDHAMHQLKKRDRDAVLLRYFENLAFDEIGARMGLSANAARMRVDRALERLRAVLTRRGINTATALSVVLSTRAPQIAPAGLAGTVTHASLAAGGGTSTSVLLRIIAMTKTKTAVVSALAIACVVAPFALQQRAAATLRQQRERLRDRTAAITKMEAENQRLARDAQESARARQELAELQQLRAEAQAAAPRVAAVTALRRQNQRLQSSIEKPRNPLQAKEEIIATELSVRDWLIAFRRFADMNGGHFPADFEKARAFLPESATDATGSDFEIIYHGSPSALEKPGDVIVLQQKQAKEPLPSDGGRKATWSKIYGFADGSVRLQQEPDGDFQKFEKEHSAGEGSRDRQ